MRTLKAPMVSARRFAVCDPSVRGKEVRGCARGALGWGVRAPRGYRYPALILMLFLAGHMGGSAMHQI